MGGEGGRGPDSLTDNGADRLAGMLAGKEARDAVVVAFWGSTTRDAHEMADLAINALRPHVAALVAQARADGAAEERERIARHLERTADASSSRHNAAIWRAAAQTARSTT